MSQSKKVVLAKPNTSVTFKYVFRDDYTPTYANGAYGGVTPHGEIVANFYLERHALPLKEIVDSDGRRMHPDGCERNFVRMVETGVILSLETAKSISSWLNEKIKQAEKIKHSKSINTGNSKVDESEK